VLATLPVAAPSQPGFSFANLLILAVVVAVLYPVQKKIREVASRRRRERWAREDAEAEEQLRRRDHDDSGDSGGREPDGF
jgi:Sec-independent protein translocase protein TatA